MNETAVTKYEADVVSTEVSIPKVAQAMSISDVQATAKAIVTSKMIAGVTNEAEAIVKILAGQELGIGPVSSVNGVYVYNGNIGMKVSLAGALLRRRGWRWDTVWDDVDNPTACEITFYHPVFKPNGAKHRWTLSDSIRAKLIKQDGAHQKYPKAMYYNRCFMAGARIEAPDCLMNMGYEWDELKEMKAPPHVTENVSVAETLGMNDFKPPAQPVAPKPASSVPPADIPVSPEEEDIGSCPECGKPLSRKKGKFGYFISCSGYPSCKYKPPKKTPDGSGSTTPDEKTPPAASQVAKQPKEWTKEAFEETKESLILRLEWPIEKVKEKLKSNGLLTDNGLVTVANRDKVINYLVELCEIEGK